MVCPSLLGSKGLYKRLCRWLRAPHGSRAPGPPACRALMTSRRPAAAEPTRRELGIGRLCSAALGLLHGLSKLAGPSRFRVVLTPA